jgi:hypothetical protein
MPLADQPRGGTDLAKDSPPFADARDHANRDLADRLARLPSSHPSAWPATDRGDGDYREPSPEEWWHRAADGEQDEAAGEQDDITDEPDDVADEPDDVADEPDDTFPEDAELGEVADQPDDAGRGAVRARGGRRTPASSGWGELAGPSGRSPYRPWFSADGAGDPWFAVGSFTGPGG